MDGVGKWLQFPRLVRNPDGATEVVRKQILALFGNILSEQYGKFLAA